MVSPLGFDSTVYTRVKNFRIQLLLSVYKFVYICLVLHLKPLEERNPAFYFCPGSKAEYMLSAHQMLVKMVTSLF